MSTRVKMSTAPISVSYLTTGVSFEPPSIRAKVTPWPDVA
jgi:hypothetical protein